MSDGISAERLSQLVGLIYDAAIDPARWPTVMEEIRTELGFHNSTLNLQHLPSGRMLTNVTTNITPEYLAMMEGAGPDVIEQWGGAQVAMSIPLDEPAVLTQVNPAFDVRTTTNRYYLAFARPQGIVDVMAIGLARDERGIGTLSFGRHEKAGPIGAREIAVARLLVPHLQRAATINRMLDEAVLARASFEATLEVLAVPVVLVDRDSRMLYANPPARLMLERGDTIRLQDGALEARNAGAASALAVAIAHAARNESGIARRGLGIPLHGGGGGGAGALHVLPLRPGRAGGESPYGGGRIAVRSHPGRGACVRAGRQRSDGCRGSGHARRRAEHGQDPPAAHLWQGWGASPKRADADRGIAGAAGASG
jgi:PAS domain-containing protein